MESKQIVWGQRVRVNVPGLGDHGQMGTIKKMHGDTCYVHLDWDQYAHRLAVFYAADLDRMADVSPPSLAVPAA